MPTTCREVGLANTLRDRKSRRAGAARSAHGTHGAHGARDARGARLGVRVNGVISGHTCRSHRSMRSSSDSRKKVRRCFPYLLYLVA